MTDPLTGIMRRLKLIEDYLWKKKTFPTGAGGGTGDVVGPASAVDGDFAVFNGATGKLIKDGNVHLWLDHLYNLFIGNGAGAVNDSSGYTIYGKKNVSLGYHTLNRNTTGYHNTAIGCETLDLNTVGFSNTAVGNGVLLGNVNGYENTAIGERSMESNVDGYANVAIGDGSLAANSHAVGNVAIGEGALGSGITGVDNTALGYAAGLLATGLRNVFIGKEAGKNETGNDKLYIANSSTATPLIGGDFSTAVLTINGELDVDGDLVIKTAGDGIKIKTGANATAGVATLVAGTVVVSTTKVTANSIIILTPQILGTITRPVAVGVTARTAGTSFTITSQDVTDTSIIGWVIVEPA
jgi:hypothetical protein